ncbi:hypothetical protein FB567DRAFT_1876 [Paraphoma chrysanthemicola]|uniref:Uncharacterized protein n=1 Tax=Paraphoma chrysanthemicola TaxID=798071 RepID=A0A8K0RIH3_9PLEO|nr:hypothetical protein FB567DRAFT_1876 [Paraphoma chrysanthemicola]
MNTYSSSISGQEPTTRSLARLNSTFYTTATLDPPSNQDSPGDQFSRTKPFVPNPSTTMSDSTPSSSHSRSSDNHHTAAIDKITQDAEGASNLYQTTKDEIAAAIEGAELVGGVLGPAPQEHPPREYRQVVMKHINAAWQFICMIFGYVLAICDFIRGAVVATVIGFRACLKWCARTRFTYGRY